MTIDRKNRDVAVARSSELAPGVRSLVLRTCDGGPFAWTAGQWVNLLVPTEEEALVRAYSIAAPPDPAAPDSLEFAVTRVEGGAASSALCDLAVGAQLEMSGPFGFFTLDHAPPDAPITFVGTGTGVTPLRAMIRDELRRPSKRSLTLLFGCRTEDDILYRDEFEALAQSDERFRYAVTLSRGAEGWGGRRGYVQTHLHEFCTDERTHVYVCGLSAMVKDVRRLLKAEHGYDRKRIHTERYD